MVDMTSVSIVDEPANHPTAPAPTEQERRLAAASFSAYGSNPGIKHFRSESGRSSLPYQTWGPVVVVLGGASGDPDELTELRARFAKRAGRRPIVWYGRGVADNPGDVLIGQEAIVRPATFTLSGSKMQNLRTTVRKIERTGMTVRTGSWAQLPRWIREDILSIEHAWMGKHHFELRFSTSRFAFATEDDRPWMVATSEDGVEAYVTWLESPDGKGWILDLMRRRKEGVNGAMDFLLVKGIEKARDRKVTWVSLGVAPPEQEAGRKGISGRVSNIFNHGSLRSYKKKFQPEWHDRYLVLPRSLAARQMALMAVAGVHVGRPTRGAKRSRAPQPPMVGPEITSLAQAPAAA